MKGLWQAVKMVYAAHPGGLVRRLIYMLLQSLLPLASLYVLKLMIDSLEAHFYPTENAERFGLWMVVFVVIFLVNRVVSALNTVNNDVLGQRMTDYTADLMQRQAARLDMAHFDTPEYHDTYHRAQTEAATRPMQIVSAMVGVVGSAISIGGVAVLLATAGAWAVVGVMTLAILPSFAVRLYKARRIYAFRRGSTQLYRRTGYYNALLTAREPAKEVRAFNLAPLFRARFVESRTSLVSQLLAISRKIGWLDVLCAGVEALALLAVLWLLWNGYMAGAITIGTFVMLFEAFRRGQGYLQSLVGGIASLYDNRLFIGNLYEFLRLEPQVVSPAKPQAMPSVVESIEFRDVSFRYPDMQRDVLSHFSLCARRGELTTIAGRNGFGKSTMLKLLLRFYDPDQGAILINGIDIRNFDLHELRRTVGALFQDFVRYNCTLAENIGFGRSAQTLDRARMEQAAQLTGVDAIANRLPQGYDTMLGRIFDGGAELSMGQWQRVALARLFYADAPVMLLDEPMAWMDAATRDIFRKHLDELKEDHILILISHA